MAHVAHPQVNKVYISDLRSASLRNAFSKPPNATQQDIAGKQWYAYEALIHGQKGSRVTIIKNVIVFLHENGLHCRSKLCLIRMVCTVGP